jgi:site-specific DNA-methyltransferase (adenine-specific)
MTNRLYYGDNLDVLREHIASESVDLIYLDPPFNSNANYNILFKSPAGKAADSPIEALRVHGMTTANPSRVNYVSVIC